MTPSPFRASVLTLVVALMGETACARNDEERRFEALARTCAGLGAGATYAAAQGALAGSYPAGPFCSEALAAMPQGDGCGAAAPGREVCQVLHVWFSADGKACPKGRCACELRLLRSELDAQHEAASVCGARFDRAGDLP
jgi:hypothetical protein